MSQQKIDRLKEVLAELGLSEGDGYETIGAGESIQLIVSLPETERELPEELRPFAWSDYEVERSVGKGNTDKRSYSGARYELALIDYLHDLFRRIPDVIAQEKKLATVGSMEELNSYQARRQELWVEMFTANPRLGELQDELDENYY